MSTKAPLKKIRIKPQDPENADRIARELKVSPVSSRVLAARGFFPGKELSDYLNPSLKEGLPHPHQLKGLQQATELVKEVVESGGPIALASDFDVDGLSGVSQLYQFFSTLQVPTHVFVPDRFSDGYGLNKRIVEEAHNKNCKLLITIDYGTKSLAEIDLARKLGLKTIVIDHHAVEGQCAEPDVFINPQQPECGFAQKLLCASGLAWYFLVGLRSSLPNAAAIEMKEYLDLACLGTICDMVPLVGPNRVIAKRGLEVLTHSGRIGIQALKRIVGISKEVSCHDVGFTLGPRINAAGRMIHGEMVVELLTTRSESRALSIARDLHELNQERQDTERATKEFAVAQVLKEKNLPSGLVVWGDDFHTGVIGLVAQRLVEIFYRPSAVMGQDDHGQFKGSVRGIKGFNVVEALSKLSTYLLKFGGHEGAGGFSIEEKKIPEFKEAFAAEVDRQIKEEQFTPIVEADTTVRLEELSFPLVNELQKFAPFGIGNTTPTLVSEPLQVLSVQELKEAHLKLRFSDGKKTITGLYWRHRSHPLLYEGNRVRVAYRPEISSFRGSTELNMIIQAVEPSP